MEAIDLIRIAFIVGGIGGACFWLGTIWGGNEADKVWLDRIKAERAHHEALLAVYKKD